MRTIILNLLLLSSLSAFAMENEHSTSAPKPEAATYAIQYWPGRPAGYGMVKGKPGYFIYFYDKNGTVIGRYRWYPETNIANFTAIDTSKAVNTTVYQTYPTYPAYQAPSYAPKKAKKKKGFW